MAKLVGQQLVAPNWQWQPGSTHNPRPPLEVENPPYQGGDPAPLPHLGLLLGTATGSVGAATGAGTAEALAGAVGSASGVGTATSIRGAIGAAAGVGAASALCGSIAYSAGATTVVDAVSSTGPGMSPWPLPHLHLGASGILDASTGTATGVATVSAISGSIAAASGTGAAAASSSLSGMYPMPLPSLTLGASGIASVTSGVGSAIGSSIVDGHGGQAATILWGDITGEDGYRIKWGLVSGGPYTNSADVAADVTTYTIVGLEYLTNYYVVIYGLLDGIEQDPSAEIVINVGAAGAADAAGSSTAFGVSGAIYEFLAVGVGTAAAIRGYIASASGSSSVDGIRGATGASTGDGNAAGTSTAQALIGSKFFASGVVQTGDGAAAGYGMKSGAIARSDGVGYGNFVPNVLGVGSASGTGTANAVGVVAGGSVGGGGRPRRRRHYVEIDGQYFEVRDHQHAVEILTKLHEAAKEAAPEVVAQVAETVEKAPDPPRMRVVKPDYTQEFIQQLQAQVDATNAQIAKVYAEAWKAHVAQQQAIAQQILAQGQADEDDIETLISMGIM